MKKNRQKKQLLPSDIHRILLRRIEAFFFPPLCIICDDPREEKNRWLCASCLNEIKKGIMLRNSCPQCGQNRTLRTCTCEICWDYPFERIVAFSDFTTPAQTILHHIKYRGKRNLAFYLGQICSTFNLPTGGSDDYDLVVPIPLHWLRKQHRGFNQAEWFARGLFTENTRSVIDTGILRRTRGTGTQTKLDKTARQKNITGAFNVTAPGKAAINGKSILLVDDVVTTGATTAEATSVLLKNGCAKVTVIAFARD